ncbi:MULTISPECIES: TfoX/Sxy family protein [unclassified Microbacterium]|uniref:TfoX/Sxy family protein n=1 Tax=Microbacterium TaxID=33882 RepID=UPI002B47AF01|nr:TfoX/Sxy family protein [Microbacterium sp. JZ37]
MAAAERPARDALAARIRELLDGRVVREVSMFGSRAFMVDERMAVTAGKDGELLVHVAPSRHADLIESTAAEQAFMGERTMGPGWLHVAPEHVQAEDALQFWVDVSLERAG